MFRTFPYFSPVTIEDKDSYNELIADYPSVSDIAFTTLMIWWNFDDCLRISTLNDNLIISYNLPGDDKNSGLGLIGTSRIDETMQAIFARQRHTRVKQRLVHVPEFVVANIKDPGNFIIKPERDYDEYIVPISRFYPLEGARHNMRRKVKKFLKEAEGHTVEVRRVDLSDPQVCEFLNAKANEWWAKQPKNDETGNEMQALQIMLPIATQLETRNLCLYIDGEFCGFTLYHLTKDGKYAILNHIKVDYVLPRIFDYMSYISAADAAQEGAQFLNMEMDLGIPGLRMHKLEAGPADYFRKFTIRPRSF